nr:uncharacterized protein LOC123758386 [Procambarus clarkii]
MASAAVSAMASAAVSAMASAAVSAMASAAVSAMASAAVSAVASAAVSAVASAAVSAVASAAVSAVASPVASAAVSAAVITVDTECSTVSVTNPSIAEEVKQQISRINMPGRSTPASIHAVSLTEKRSAVEKFELQTTCREQQPLTTQEMIRYRQYYKKKQDKLSEYIQELQCDYFPSCLLEVILR